MGAIQHVSLFFADRSPLELVALFSTLILVFLIAKALYNVYLHPLSAYPGPKWAAASRLWFCWHSLCGDTPFTISKLHQKYGDVVRLAPNELSYIDPQAWNDIYGHRHGKPELMKDPLFYATIGSEPNSLINTNRDRHGFLRKQVSNGFSEKALREQEPVIRKYVNLFNTRLREKSCNGNQPVDMVSWLNFFTFDVMGELVFGEPFDCLSSSGYSPWVKNVFESIKFGVYQRCADYFPAVKPLVKLMLPSKLRSQRVSQRAMSREKADRRKALKDDRQDLISGFLTPNSGVTDAEYNSTCGTMIIAGSETTATLMSGAIYYLVKNPDKLKKLVTEVRETFSSPEQIDSVGVGKLPFLLATLNEALRKYPPVPDSLPRNTGPNSEILCGKPVPPNTVIRVTQWAMFHSPKHFTRPHEFIPERWLPDQEEFKDDRREVLQPFHVGPRNCVGRNLAYFEMKLIIALLVWHFDMELCQESDNWDEQKIFFFWDKPDLMVKLHPRKV